MAFQAVADTISLTCHFLLAHLTPAQFTVYCKDSGTAWDGAHMQAKAEDVADAIIADYIDALSIDHDFVGVTARDLEPEFGRVVEHTVAATPGTVNSPSLPGQIAPVCNFRSEVGAPRRGSIKLMPPAENQVVADALSGGAAAALQAAMESLHNAVGSGVGETHVIISRFSGKTLVAGPGESMIYKPTPRETVAVQTVESVDVNTLVGTQRSRRVVG